jgi:hypothetical protein
LCPCFGDKECIWDHAAGALIVTEVKVCGKGLAIVIFTEVEVCGKGLAIGIECRGALIVTECGTRVLLGVKAHPLLFQQLSG